MIVRIAKFTQPNFREKASKSGTLQLVTIPYSHYVDFARWCLQLSNVRFEENDYAPGAHILPVIALRFSNGEKNISKTSKVEAVAAKLEEKEGRKGGAPTGVPVAVLPGELGVFCIAICYCPTPSLKFNSNSTFTNPRWAYSLR